MCNGVLRNAMWSLRINDVEYLRVFTRAQERRIEV